VALACQEPPVPESNTPPLPSQIVEDFELTETSRGQKHYHLNATRAYLYDAESRIEVTRPVVSFFDASGQEVSRLYAQEGEVNLKNSDLVARNDVRVLTKDSIQLYTDSLVFRSQERLITSDAWVRIQYPTSTVAGWGLRSDPRLERIQILDSIQGSSTQSLEE
jgi:LPS export ABC transporter protein LptC